MQLIIKDQSMMKLKLKLWRVIKTQPMKRLMMLNKLQLFMGVVEDSDTESDDNDEDDRIVKESGKMELHNLTQKETWRDVDINPDLQYETKGQLWKLAQEYGDIFSDVAILTNIMKHKIELTSDVPVSSKPYKIPFICKMQWKEKFKLC
jgi:hypothetical protein